MPCSCHMQSVITIAILHSTNSVHVQMIKALQVTFRRILQPGKQGVPTYLTRVISAALVQPPIGQQIGRKSLATIFSDAPGLSCTLRSHTWSSGTLHASSLRGPQIAQRSCQMSSHSQEGCRQAHMPNSEHAASGGGQNATSVDSELSLWQQMRMAGSRGVKRKLEMSVSGQIWAPKSRKEKSSQRTDQQESRAAAGGPRRQAQPGRNGLTDLGQGAQVIYCPGIFSRTEGATLLTALQVATLLS